MEYFILNADQIDNIDFSMSPNKKETVRWNLDKSKFIVKFLDSNDLENPMTSEEIIYIISNPENGWIEEEGID